MAAGLIHLITAVTELSTQVFFVSFVPLWFTQVRPKLDGLRPPHSSVFGFRVSDFEFLPLPLVHELHESLHVFDRRAGQDAVAEIEDVARRASMRQR
jgi:hypothetical protein